VAETKEETAGERRAAPRRPSAKSRKDVTTGPLTSYLVPLALCTGTMPLAVVLHLVWGTSMLMVALLGALTALLPLYVHTTWHKRHEHTRITASVFTLVVCVWLTVAVAAGPFGTDVLDLWGLGVLVMPLAWVLRHTGLSGGTEHDVSRSGADTMLARLRTVLSGLREHKVVTGSSGTEVSAEYAYPAGEMTAADVQAALPNIASALELPASAVSVVPVTGPGNRVRITAQAADPLAGSPLTWPGFSARGTSVNDSPLRFGRRSDGRDEGLWVCGDPAKDRQLVHTMGVGMPGSGKSDTGVAIILDGLSRVDFVPVVASSVKFAQTYGDIAEALPVAADGPEQTFQLIANFPAVIAYRSQLIGSLRKADGSQFKQWEPELWTEHGIPLVFVVLDEAASVTHGNEDFNEGVRVLRSLGVHLLVEIQSAIGTSIDRNIRDMIGQRLAHGCMSDIDTGFALHDSTVAAGADPTKWGANKAGAHYAELTGVPADQWHLECRSFRTDAPGLRSRVLAETKGSRAVLDPGTAFHLGNGIKRPDCCLPSVPDVVTAVLEQAGDTDTVRYLADMPADDLPEADPEYADVDASEPIPYTLPAGTPVPVRAVQPAGPASPAAAREAFERRFEELAAERSTVTAADFAEVRYAVGRSRNWPLWELKRLEERGLVKQEEPGSKTWNVRQRAA
jgi:hypothetical protein